LEQIENLNQQITQLQEKPQKPLPPIAVLTGDQLLQEEKLFSYLGKIEHFSGLLTLTDQELEEAISLIGVMQSIKQDPTLYVIEKDEIEKTLEARTRIRPFSSPKAPVQKAADIQTLEGEVAALKEIDTDELRRQAEIYEKQEQPKSPKAEGEYWSQEELGFSE